MTSGMTNAGITFFGRPDDEVSSSMESQTRYFFALQYLNETKSRSHLKGIFVSGRNDDDDDDERQIFDFEIRNIKVFLFFQCNFFFLFYFCLNALFFSSSDEILFF